MRHFKHKEEPELFCGCDHNWSDDIRSRCVVRTGKPNICIMHGGCTGHGRVVIGHFGEVCDEDEGGNRCIKCSLYPWHFEERE